MGVQLLCVCEVLFCSADFVRDRPPNYLPQAVNISPHSDGGKLAKASRGRSFVNIFVFIEIAFGQSDCCQNSTPPRDVKTVMV